MPEARELAAILAERGARSDMTDVVYLAGRVAVRLEELREERGLTLQAIADEVGTSRAHISRLLSGRYTGFTLSTLVRLARALGCDVDIQFRTQRGAPRIAETRSRPGTVRAVAATARR